MGVWLRTWRWRWSVIVLAAAGCGLRSTAGDLYPEIAAHAGKEIRDVRFANTEPFSGDTLLHLIETRPSRCNLLGLPFCLPFTRIGREEHRLNAGRVLRDTERLASFYRVEGYFGTTVVPAVEADDNDDVHVSFTIRRGDPITLDALLVRGTEGVVDPDSLARTLPLQPGAVFDLAHFAASADIVLGALTSRGHAYAEVLRSFFADTIANRAEATLEAVPGPRVVVDSIIILGADNLGYSAALRQLGFRPGEVLRRSRLLESQRNLYALELVRLASVSVAPDSLQHAPQDSSTATVLVQLAEAPVHQVDAALGFGTVECLQTEVQWLSRSFGGGARRLALGGSLSRIGVGEPFAVRAGSSVCSSFPGDTAFAGNAFDYRLNADLLQPYFLTPRNQLALNVFMERLSEPPIFQRQGTGGRISLIRRLREREVLTVGVDAERSTTQASHALFCASFRVCELGLADSLARARFRSELGVSYLWDRSDIPLNPTAGFVVRTALAWAPSWLGSQLTFVRWSGEAAWYRELRPGTVGAFSARLGHFFRTATLDPSRNFLPPEERFFAGGASSVRGFERNALGQGVYVTTDSLVVEDGALLPAGRPQFVPTGGTSVAVMNAELRFPSPFLSDILRMAAFVDVGTVGTRSLWDIALGDWRVTPGVGVRLTTPVGPVRVDLGYRPYDPAVGPLLLADNETGRLVRVLDEFRPDRGGLLSRLRVHLAIGQAF